MQLSIARAKLVGRITAHKSRFLQNAPILLLGDMNMQLPKRYNTFLGEIGTDNIEKTGQPIVDFVQREQLTAVATHLRFRNSSKPQTTSLNPDTPTTIDHIFGNEYVEFQEKTGEALHNFDMRATCTKTS